MASFLSVNEGMVDRVLRIVVGLIGISLVFVGPKSPLGWIGAVLVLTGIVGICPLYAIFGVSTCPKKSA